MTYKIWGLKSSGSVTKYITSLLLLPEYLYFLSLHKCCKCTKNHNLNSFHSNVLTVTRLIRATAL